MVSVTNVCSWEHHQGTEEARVDQAILELLLHERPSLPWAVEELAREIGDRVTVEDSLGRLHGAGLVHRLREGFVFASRAAFRAHELAS